jgi:uncharacterized delta-60 repeat protein
MRRIAALFACLLFSIPAAAAPADLDPTFGTGGILRPDFGPPTSVNLTASTRQPDGKIVVAGEGDQGYSGSPWIDLVLSRFNADGTLDATFGRNGWSYLSGGGVGEARAMAVQADGKVVVLMHGANGISFGKVLPDGTRDDSFAMNHGIVHDYGSDFMDPRALAIQPDGKYVVAGSWSQFGGAPRSFVARYHPNGSRDLSFGWNGVWSQSFSAEDGVSAVALAADGSIFFAGQSREAGQSSDVFVGRLWSNGSQDWSYGTGGLARVDHEGAEDTAAAVAFDQYGRLLVAGRTAAAGQGRYLVARFDNFGLDASFGVAGKTVVDVPVLMPNDGDAVPRALVVDELGQPSIAGTVQHLASGDRTFALVRLESSGGPMASWGSSGVVVGPLSASSDTLSGLFDAGSDRWLAAGLRVGPDLSRSLQVRYVASTGEIDASFGAGGIAVHEWQRSTFDTAADIAIAPDGKLVAAGASVEFGLVARFHADGSPDATFADNGVLRLPGGLPGSPAAVAVQPDLRIVVASESPFGASRFNVDGTRDSSWNGGAHAVVNLPALTNVTAVALQPDGRVVLAGNTWQDRMVFARLNADGTLDTSFNGTGYLLIDRGFREVVRAIAVQPDGRIVAAGHAENEPMVLRLQADGTPDPTWNGVGFAVLGTLYDASFFAIGLRPDGRVVASGYCGGDSCAATLLPDGTVDPAFGLTLMGIGSGFYGGRIGTGVGAEDEKTVVASTNPSSQVSVVRLLPDGTRDPTYGNGGLTSSGRPGMPQKARLQADGKLVVFAEEPFTYGWQLLRFEGGGGDNVPDDFDFQDVTGVPVNTLVTSAPVTIAGLTISAQIGVSDGEYSIGCNGFFTDLPGTIENGQSVCVRHMSGSISPDMRITRLTIGGISGYFASTTGMPPETTITSAPANPSNVTAPSFSFSSNDAAATLECSLDGAAFAACTSPHAVQTLADGNHDFRVRAVGPAGADTTPATHSWVVDATPPDTNIPIGPASVTASTVASFSFTGTGQGPFTYECSLDGAAFAACTSPKEFSGLAEGAHQFRVKAADSLGNMDATPAVRSWTVDLTGPDTTVVTGPPAVGNSNVATFTFTASESPATFECKDASASTWIACTSPLVLNGVPDGTHAMLFRAKDAVGNPDATPAQWTFTVDTVAPQTAIDGGPAGPVASTSAVFTFSADGAATFECSLDGAAFAACTSPASYGSLAQGAHTFQVRARDAAGNIDASPATGNWTVDTVVPATTITVAPGNNTQQPATFQFTSDEGGAGFECRVDAEAFAACTSPKEYTTLSKGNHTFQVRARDAVGNVDATPASHTWRVR